MEAAFGDNDGAAEAAPAEPDNPPVEAAFGDNDGATADFVAEVTARLTGAGGGDEVALAAGAFNVGAIGAVFALDFVADLTLPTQF